MLVHFVYVALSRSNYCKHLHTHRPCPCIVLYLVGCDNVVRFGIIMGCPSEDVLAILICLTNRLALTLCLFLGSPVNISDCVCKHGARPKTVVDFCAMLSFGDCSWSKWLCFSQDCVGNGTCLQSRLARQNCSIFGQAWYLGVVSIMRLPNM